MEIWKTYSSDLSTEEAKNEYIVEYANMWQTVELATIKKCIDNGFDVNKQDSVSEFMSLHWAVCYTCPIQLAKVLKMLLENGAKVNATDNRGRTPLHWAAEGNDHIVDGEPLSVDVLLKARADVHKKDIDGNTPIHLAAMYNKNHHVLKSLLNTDGAKEYLLGDNGELLLKLAKDAKNSFMVIDVIKKRKIINTN